MSDLLIRNGLVVDPLRKTKEKLDIFVRQGKIAALGPSLSAPGAEVLEAGGQVVTPGLIDLHAHLCDPGFTLRESIPTGTRSAARGGFTTVFSMPNTEPVIDNIPVATYVRTRAKEEGLVRVFPVGAITKGLKGQEMAPLGGYKASGLVAMVSDDENPTMDAEVLRRAMAYNQDLGLVFSLHCEDVSLSRGGQVREGFASLRLGVRGIPDCAESIMVARNILLGQATGTPVHIAHVGTAESVEIIRRAKARGLRVTAEVTPYHLLFSEDDLAEYDVQKKFYPPLGPRAAILALEGALRDGTIDAITSDHNPWTVEEKDREFDQAPFGAVGLEIAFAAAYTRLVRGGVLSLEELVPKFTSHPARIVNLPLGRLEVGAEADLAVFDLEREWTVDPGRFLSLSRNTPLAGGRLYGTVEATVVRGRVVMQGGEIFPDRLPFAAESGV